MPATNSKRQSRILPRHRIVLLISAAILGATVLFAGPGVYAPISVASSVSSARAADSTVTHPASFADLVAKVKPAVISVRVKIDESAKMTGLDQNDQENMPSTPGFADAEILSAVRSKSSERHATASNDLRCWFGVLYFR
jgi:serine protease Do